MTITALPFRTAIAVVVIAVFAAFSISPTHADDTTAESTTTTAAAVADTTTSADAETTTTNDDATPAGDGDTTTTTTAATTTTVADTTTTTTAATTTTVADTTTTTTIAPPPPITTTTVAPTTTTTLPAEPEVAELDETDPDYCDPETAPTGVDTDEATSGEATATVTTTTVAEETGAVDGEEPTDDDFDPCNPPEEDELGFTPVERIEVVRDIVFPIVGRAGYYDGFGACRDGCTREHHGIDIGTFGWKGLPVVASHDGTVVRTTYDQRLAGCAVILVGDDGWESRYVHLNTDYPGTDTNGYSCLVPGIGVGSEVVAGQIIGYVGDSGNAEHTIPHIHFEIRTPDGTPINAYESLNAARTVDFEWLPQDPSIAYNTIVAANYPDIESTAVIVSAAEALKLSVDESAALVYHTPVIVIDESDPDSGLEQIKRLELVRAIVRADTDADWISALVAPLVDIVETEAFPVRPTLPKRILPDSGETVLAEDNAVESNPVDRFATIIARSADEVQDADIVTADDLETPAEDTSAEYLEALDQYTIDHRAAVLSSGSEAVEYLSAVDSQTPSRSEELTAAAARARRASNTDNPPTPLPLWWNTGDEWVWTDDPLDVPDRGVVYLTETQATPWTLAFLSSVVELDPMPIWRG